jgi:hypothetical protein
MKKSSLLTYCAEIARCFGSDATGSAVTNVFKRQVRPAAKAITNTLSEGGDSKDLNFLDTLWTREKGSPGTPFDNFRGYPPKHVSFCLKTSSVVHAGFVFIDGLFSWCCLLFPL